MELVEGIDLEQALREKPATARAAARLVAILARTMQVVHVQGPILHRDLKPKNVLLKAPPGTPLDDCTPIITDFGLAKLLNEHGVQTPSCNPLGTPSYMAPEQAQGGMARELGVTVDVYALGAILYQCLTGQPPFRAETPLETLLRVVRDEPAPPSQLRPAVPRDLETICLKCLHKEPARRYANALALAEDLERWLRGEPIHARPVGALEQLWCWARRNRLAASLASLLAVSMAAALPVVTWQWRRAEANARAARANFVETRRALSDFGMAVQDELSVRSGVQATRKKLVQQVVQHCGRLLDERGDDIDLLYLTGTAYEELGIVYRDLGPLQEARTAFREAADLLQQFQRERPEHFTCRAHLAAIDMYLGIVLDAAGEWRDAVDFLQKALQEFEDLARQPSNRKDWDQRNVGVCYSLLGDIYASCDRLNEASTCYQKARVIQEAFIKQDRSGLRPNNADSLDRIAENDDGTGWMHQVDGRPEEALRFLKQARDRRKQLVDADPANIRRRGNLATTDLHLSIVYLTLRKADEARSTLQQAYAALEPLSRENPEVLGFQRTLAEVYLQMGNLQHGEGQQSEALRSFERAHQISANLLRDNPTLTQSRVTLAESYTGMSRVLQAQGQPVKALDAMRQAQVGWQNLVNEHSDIPRFRRGLAGVGSELARLKAGQHR
jgi:serine/threonine-protein kinase